MLDGSIFLPRMKVEIFHVEERFVILGLRRGAWAPTRASRSTVQLEAEEEGIFYRSFKVGPKPSACGNGRFTQLDPKGASRKLASWSTLRTSSLRAVATRAIGNCRLSQILEQLQELSHPSRMCRPRRCGD